MNKEERNLWIVFTVSIALLAFGVLALHFHSNRAVIKGLRTFSADSGAQTGRSTPVISVPPRPEESFGIAVDQLASALRKSPTMTPQEMILKVNAKAPVGTAQPCPIEIQGGQVAMSLGRDANGHMSLTDTVKGCAESIEHFRE